MRLPTCGSSTNTAFGVERLIPKVVVRTYGRLTFPAHSSNPVLFETADVTDPNRTDYTEGPSELHTTWRVTRI